MINSQEEQLSVSNSGQTDEEIIKQVYAFAARRLFDNKQSKKDVINELNKNGLHTEDATIVVKNLISKHNEYAKKNMLYGSLWCIGGTIATLAHIGFIFWGAIVFGAIQFFKGLINLR